MHFVLLSALLVIAPALATVERRGYQPKRRAMSPEEIFGLAKRQTAGYEPGQTTCSGTGTCEQACGAGYAACGVDFCYLPASQVCCSSTSEACDDGYYCTVDNAGDPWCCPNGDDLASCAAIYGVTGLSSVAAATTSASGSASAAPAITSSSASTTTTSAAGSPKTNSTVTTGSTPQFTGAANLYAVGGYALPLVLAGAAIAVV